MRLLCCCVLAGWLLVGCAAGLSPEGKQFVGTWSGQGQDQSYSWKLAGDGSFGEAPGFVFPSADKGSWRIEGDTLIVTLKGADGKPTERRYNVRLSGNTLTVDRGNGVVDVLSKVQ